MNKKWLAVMMLLVTMMLAVTGCGKNVVGTWTISAVEMDGQTIEWSTYTESLGAALGEVDEDEMSFEMDVKKDGTFSVNFGGEEAEGTWKEKGGKYVLTSDGIDQEATIKDGKLKFEEASMNATLILEKK